MLDGILGLPFGKDGDIVALGDSRNSQLDPGVDLRPRGINDPRLMIRHGIGPNGIR